MTDESPRGTAETRYARMTRLQAALALSLLLASIVWCQRGARAPESDPMPRVVHAESDLKMYRRIVERVRAGEGYYDVVGAELRQGDYPLRPMFNWRQPTCALLLAHLPSVVWGKILLALMAAATVVISFLWIGASSGRARATVAALLVAWSLMTWQVDDHLLFHEAWAAYAMVLSLGLFAMNRWPLAVVVGLAALAFRELALLPCAVGLLVALSRRRRAEALAWVAGLVFYAALMTWHGWEVARRVRPDDLSRSWVTFGGATFLVAAGHWSPLLVLLPGWMIATALPLSLFGLAGWRDPTGTRMALTLGGYFLAFLVVGHPFNHYWGILIAPLLPFGLLWVPDSLRDTWRAFAGTRSKLSVRVGTRITSSGT